MSQAAARKGTEPFATRRNVSGGERIQNEDALAKKLVDAAQDYGAAKENVARISNHLAEKEREKTDLNKRIVKAEEDRPDMLKRVVTVQGYKKNKECDKIIDSCNRKLIVVDAEIKSTKRDLRSAKNVLQDARLIEDARNQRRVREKEEREQKAMRKQNVCTWIQEPDIDLGKVQRRSGLASAATHRRSMEVKKGQLFNAAMDLGEVQETIVVQHNGGGSSKPAWEPVAVFRGSKEDGVRLSA